MHKLCKSFILFCALALIAAACGGDDDSADAAADVAPETSEVAEVTTSTEAPPSTTTSTTTTTTTIAVPSGPTLPLTGEQVGDDGGGAHPAVVIKISNNDTTARQAMLGLAEADIVFEERIEQQATRFAAVFHSTLPTEVGSVRSGRTSDVDIVSNLNRPVFAFSGANDGVNGQIRQAENDGLLVRASNELADSQFRRISDFSAPNNLVVDAAALLEKVEGGEAPQAIFDYGNNVTEIGTPSPGVRVAARTDAAYTWLESAGGYLRFQGGDQSVGRDGAPVVPQNVVVLTTSYVPSQIDAASVDAVTVGEGPVVVYSNGFRVEGTWTRSFARDPYTFVTPDGQTIGLAPGQTWVSLAPAGTNAELSQIDAEGFING